MNTNEHSTDDTTERSPRVHRKSRHSAPLVRVRSPFKIWRLRREMRKSGTDPNWINDNPTSHVWVLQKNSSVPKRVLAVSSTSQQRHRLDDLTSQRPNHDMYVWHGFEVQGMPRPQQLHEVHAVVSLREPVVKVTAASKVRVESVHLNQSDAERERDRQAKQFPTTTWAVVTYPVGELLF